MSENVSRRNLFQILGAAVPAAAVAAGAPMTQHNHGGGGTETAQAKGPYQRQTFDDHQWQTVRVLCDLIIPADESGPSASAADEP